MPRCLNFPAAELAVLQPGSRGMTCSGIKNWNGPFAV